jgi:hypothetical protein
MVEKRLQIKMQETMKHMIQRVLMMPQQNLLPKRGKLQQKRK